MKIYNRYSGEVIFEGDDNVRSLVEEAVGLRINLSYANLTGANLTGANLSYANLTDADLIDANLTGANLTGASLIDQ